jgi:hypothetical protein
MDKYNAELAKAGALLSLDGLMPPEKGARVRYKGGKPTVTDGPFTEAKEVVAGFYLIEADTLQEATEIASRIPSAALGTIEVRPCRQLIVEGRPLRWG